MISSDLDFSGLLDISKDLELLSKAETNKVMRQATNAAASMLRDEVRSKAPRRTGKLARNVMSGNQRNRKEGSVSSGVYVRGSNKEGTNSDRTMKGSDPNNAFYWRFIENGTSKMAPHPFIRPTFDSKADAAAEIAINKLNQAIDEVLNK